MRWKGPLVFRGSDGPIARSDESAERATVAWHSLGKLRSTRILPPRTAPSRGGFPVRRPMSLTPGPVPAFADSRSLCSSTSGHHFWWRVKCLSPPGDFCNRLRGPNRDCSRMAQFIHRSGQVIPRLGEVVHQFIHKQLAATGHHRGS